MEAFKGHVGFNAHHSPMGAYFSFTCGHAGTRGGMGVQMGRPAEQDIFVGYKEGDRYADVPLRVMPFFNGADKLDAAAAFMPEKEGEDPQRFAPIGVGEMERFYGWGTDRWQTRDGLEFSIYTPFGEIPEPGVGDEGALKMALVPAVAAEVRVDNRGGVGVRTGFFAIGFREGGVRLLELEGGRIGIGFRRELGFAVEVVEVGEDLRCRGKVEGGAFAFIKWWPHEGLEDRSNPVHLLGTCGGVGFEVPAGKHYALRIVMGCHLEGVVTTRLRGRYFYNRYFDSVEDVLNFAGPLFSTFKKAASALDKELVASGLSRDQQFLVAHAVRSYYGNTQLLELVESGEPYWIVNEGEYCMMNTLDLAVDQVFWELERNPWVVRNLLDGFLKRYSYYDDVNVLTEDTENTEDGKTTREGGISFTHDQGTHNQFSPVGRSAYELRDLRGCFSFMTQEQLCNWVLMAVSYVARTNDWEWLKHNRATMQQCVVSMSHRRNEYGIPTSDSSLCGSGREITTFDSLDSSLGQAAGSSYLAVKYTIAFAGLACLASHEDIYFELNDPIPSMLNAEQFIPALLSEDALPNVRTLPTIESLLFALAWKQHGPEFDVVTEKRYATSVDTLRAHAVSLLSDLDRRNKFADNGIKLSSTSDNSWLSKIAIVQFVARQLFNLDENGNERAADAGASGWERADAAHVGWLTTGAGAYWCACDQIVKGEAKGSKYYPRLVTMALWLNETKAAKEGAV